MKQLLFNFLFFVAAAIVFIQCAKFFPSNERNLQHKVLMDKKNFDAVSSANKISANTVTKNNKSKTAILVPFSNHSSVPYRMMIRINGHRIFYNPYIIFKDYNLAANNSETWQ